MALSIYSMEKYINILDELIKEHVFIASYKEKIDKLRRRDDIKNILIDMKEFIEQEIKKVEADNVKK